MGIQIKKNGKWHDIAGCGMLKPETLKEAGYDPSQVAGYSCGLGLERLTALKFDLKTVKELWQQPYVKDQRGRI